MNLPEDDPKLPLLSRGQFRRRDILVMGSVLAASPLLSRASRAQELMAAAAKGQPISLGFVENSEQIANLRHVAGQLRRALRPLAEGAVADAATQMQIVPAGSLPSGDPALANHPVRMRIQGFFPNLPKTALPYKVDLDVVLRSPELPQGATFFAWSYRGKPENLSAPVAFNVSPDFFSQVTLVLRVQAKNDKKPAVTQSSTFTLGDDAGKPRLVRGAYLLAVSSRAWDRPVSFSPELPRASLLSLLITVDPTAAAA